MRLIQPTDERLFEVSAGAQIGMVFDEAIQLITEKPDEPFCFFFNEKPYHVDRSTTRKDLEARWVKNHPLEAQWIKNHPHG